MGSTTLHLLKRAGTFEKTVGEPIELSSGLLSDTKVYVDRLLGHPFEHQIIMRDVKSKVDTTNSKVIVPIPNGARDVIWPIRRIFDGQQVAFPHKLEKRIFAIDEADKRLICAAGHIALFEDVITTGLNASIMAEQVHEINPEAVLHLIAVLRRGDILPEHATHFVSQDYLAEEIIPAWQAQ